MKNNFLLEITVFLWKFRVIKNEGHVWFNLIETKYMLWYNNATMNKRNYQILKYLKDGENVIDIGTGAGFPGIPVKILNENLNVTLVDSLNKRINFLNEVCIALDLKNIELIHSRAEDLAKNKSYRENFDKSVSRAVANLTTLPEYD